MSAAGKRELRAKAVELRNAGRLFDPSDAEMQELFAGSIDRFCDIALKLQGLQRVLDVGAGHGMLVALLASLGIYRAHGIAFQRCNIEVEALPFADAAFDAVVCCQVLEHFTHSHLPAVREMHRVLRVGGLLEVDVPNVASLRNRSRLLRGKNITYDYVEHYLEAKPVLYAGHSFYPLRHNREFTRAELGILLEKASFRRIDVRFLRSRRYRTGLGKLQSLGSALRDLWPSGRKSLIAFAEK